MQIGFSLWKLVLLIAGSGAFGGLVSAIIVKDRHHIACFDGEKTKARPFQDDICFFLGRILMGVAGGMAITCFGIWAKFLDTIVDKGDLLFLSGLCVLVGAFSDRLLAGMASRLEEQMGILAQKTGAAQNTAQTAAKVAETMSAATMDYAAGITAADSALRGENMADAKQAIELLLKLESTFPKDRTLHILLGRLYRKIGDLRDAILILRTFIKNLHLDSATPIGGSIPDCGVAYYNIACYHALWADKETGDEKNRLEKEALESLEIAIEKLDACRKYAQGDSDFDGIRNNPRFKKLIEDSSGGRP